MPSRTDPGDEPPDQTSRTLTFGAGEGRSTQAGVDLSQLPVPLDWDRYEVTGYLGAGGMGHVFRAIDRTLRRPVALKFLRQGVAPGERFLREARAQAAIEHENVCRVYEVGEVNGQPYIAMQLIEGGRLDEVAEGLSRERIVALMVRAAQALHAAHRTGLIHRDVKPANVLVTASDDGGLQPVLVDFGLARQLGTEGATTTVSISGTPAYMAPEQARGIPVDRRVDVYGLGAVLYELLVGEPPVKAANLAVALREVVEGTPTPLRRLDPTIPRDLETIVATCLEKDPNRRYPSARALAEDLQRFLDGESIAARRPTLFERAVRWLRRRRVVAASVALAVLALTIGTAVALRARLDARRAGEAAQFFAGEVARLETETRLASMVPTGEPGALRTKLDEAAIRLEREMDARGPVARAAGLAALGRLALLRGDLEAARHQLGAALAAGASAAARADLGQALARAWSEALVELPVIADSGLAAAERRRLEQELRDPALALLRDDVPEGPGRLVRARLELCAGNFEEAARIGRAAAEADPWRFEARSLVAEAEIEAATASLQQGNTAGAGVQLARARDELAQALVTAPRDLVSRVIACRIEQLDLTRATWGKVVEVGQIEAMAEVCDAALRTDPDSTIARRTAVSALSTAADAASRRGFDPSAWIQRGLAISADAAGRHDAGLWRARGRLLSTASDRAARRGEDVMPMLAEAAAALSAAIELAPTSPDIHNSLGAVFYRRAQAQARAGLDPGADLDRAIFSLGRAASLAPGSAAAHTNLGSALVLLSEVRQRQGTDAFGPLDQAIASFDRALGLDPSRPAFHNNRGNAFLTRAELLLDQPQPAAAATAEAVASYRQALTLRPQYAMALHNLAWALRLTSDAELVSGRDPAKSLQAARAAIHDAIALDPGDASSLALLARIEVLALVAGDSDGRGAARSAIAAGRGIDPALAELDLAEAELQLAQGDEGALEHIRQVVSARAELRPMSRARVLLAAKDLGK